MSLPPVSGPRRHDPSADSGATQRLAVPAGAERETAAAQDGAAPSAEPTAALPASGPVSAPGGRVQASAAQETMALPASQAERTTVVPVTGERATTVMPASVMPTSQAQVPQSQASQGQATSVMPVAVPPQHAGPAPGRPTYQPQAPQPTYRQPEPQPRADLPLSPQRRRSAALPVGTVMLLVTLGLLGWGFYTLLSTFQFLDLFLRDVSLTEVIDLRAAAAVAGGAVLAFVTVMVSLTAVSRSRPRTAAIALLLGALLLPLGASGAGIYYGGSELRDQTLAQAQTVSGQVDAGEIDSVLNQVEEQLGIEVPGHDELMEILGSLQGQGGRATQ
ncbi:hypothetical protein [Actinomyces lilanjuaniae]|nr:hypothetical protein [Actinomyces lilanjuaniae]